MSTSAIGSTSSASQIHQTTPHFGPDVTLMNPQDILDYVAKALGNIGEQLNDYKETVKLRQKQASDLREVTSFLRTLGSDHNVTNLDPAKYNHVMTLLEKYKDSNSAANAAYEQLLGGYGSYCTEGSGAASLVDQQAALQAKVDQSKNQPSVPVIDPKTQQIKLQEKAEVTLLKNQLSDVSLKLEQNGGYHHGTGDGMLNPTEMSIVLKSMEEAQQSLNADNELVMMNLQQLMQQRNQITQFSSNAMNTMNESMKSVIGNIR